LRALRLKRTFETPSSDADYLTKVKLRGRMPLLTRARK
jgi:hypothetical protein